MDRSSTERDVIVGTPEVRWLERGQGPPVVFLHDLLRHMHDWDDVLDRLATAARGIAPELPIFDPALEHATIETLVGWLRTTLDALGIDRPLLVGHGLGAHVALGFAVESAMRTAGLILTALESENERGARPEILVQARVREFTRAMARYNAGRAIARLGIPTLLVFGGRDRMLFPDRAAPRAGRRTPTIAVVPEWGPAPMIEHPDAFAAVVRAWMAKTARARPSLRVG